MVNMNAIPAWKIIGLANLLIPLATSSKESVAIMAGYGL